MIDANDMCIYGIFTYIFWLLQNVSRILIWAAISEPNVTESSCIRSTYVACMEESRMECQMDKHFLANEKRVYKFLRKECSTTATTNFKMFDGRTDGVRKSEWESMGIVREKITL